MRINNFHSFHENIQPTILSTRRGQVTKAHSNDVLPLFLTHYILLFIILGTFIIKDASYNSSSVLFERSIKSSMRKHKKLAKKLANLFLTS